MISQEQINDLKKRRDDLFKFLDIENKKSIDLNFNKEVSSNDFWNNSDKAEKILKKKKQNKNWLDSFDNINMNIEDLEVLIELEAKEEVSKQYKTTLDLCWIRMVFSF